jgi:hypothetical protein
MLKVETQELFTIHLHLEKKILLWQKLLNPKRTVVEKQYKLSGNGFKMTLED